MVFNFEAAGGNGSRSNYVQAYTEAAGAVRAVAVSHGLEQLRIVLSEHFANGCAI